MLPKNDESSVVQSLKNVDRSDYSTCDNGAFVVPTDVAAILQNGGDATLATNRPDGWPQATVVNIVSDGALVFFDCHPLSQKARNIALDDKVSLAMVLPYWTFGSIFAVSIAGHAREIDEPAQLAAIYDLWRRCYPHMNQRLDENRDNLKFYGIKPVAASMLDFTTGLGHRQGK